MVKKTQITITIRPDQVETLEKLAESHDRSKASMLRKVIDVGVKELNKK